MMTQSRAESTRGTYNYGQYINQFARIRPIFLVINGQLFWLYNFSKFLYIFTLCIHPSTHNITNKTLYSPDDGSAEPKLYSVDWLCFSINPYFLLRWLVDNFSSKLSDYYPLFSSTCEYIKILWRKIVNGLS